MSARGCIQARILSDLGLFALCSTDDEGRDEHDASRRDDFNFGVFHFESLVIEIGQGDAQSAI